MEYPGRPIDVPPLGPSPHARALCSPSSAPLPRTYSVMVLVPALAPVAHAQFSHAQLSPLSQLPETGGHEAGYHSMDHVARLAAGDEGDVCVMFDLLASKGQPCHSAPCGSWAACFSLRSFATAGAPICRGTSRCPGHVASDTGPTHTSCADAAEPGSLAMCKDLFGECRLHLNVG